MQDRLVMECMLAFSLFVSQEMQTSLENQRSMRFISKRTMFSPSHLRIRSAHGSQHSSPSSISRIVRLCMSKYGARWREDGLICLLQSSGDNLFSVSCLTYGVTIASEGVCSTSRLTFVASKRWQVSPSWCLRFVSFTDQTSIWTIRSSRPLYRR